MKRFTAKRVLIFIAIFIVAIFVFGTVVMELWNAILPAVLGVKTITFLQALGILLLSKILFGGFKGRGCHGGRGSFWKQKMQEKLSSMTPEEREKFKSNWKARCGGRWRMPEEDTTVAD